MFKTVFDPGDCEVHFVTRFLNAGNIKPVEIHNQLVEIYGENVTSDTMVRKWGRQFNGGSTIVHDDARSGQLSVISDSVVEKVNEREKIPKPSVLPAMTKRVLFQHRSGASASFVHMVLRKFTGVEVKVLMGVELFWNEKVSNHGSIPITIDCNVVAFIVFEEGFHQPIKRTKHDEAHFWLNGYVNKQNCRIWSEAKLQVYVETPLHPEKLTVWCALWAGGILLQNDEGHNVTVNGDRYRAMITNFFIPELNNHDVQEL
ncbi:uncharacterized protein TNCV_140791 [Trichonephila clavipes]|nr:uncharacterized protein TNCV_140791 [Trichonephila clavipes]